MGKSKENKNTTDDLLLCGDGNSHFETDGDHLKKKKKEKRKRKSELKQDAGDDKGNPVNNELQEKNNEMGKTVDEYADGKPVKIKKKSKKNNKTDDPLLVGDDNSHVETDGERLKKKKRDKHSEKRSKSESKEGDNLVNDDLQKNDKKRKRKSSYEEEQAIENELNQNAEKKMKKKKKKTDDLSLDTEKLKVKGSLKKPKAKAKSKSKSKKVSFSGHVEVFPTSDTEPGSTSTKGDALVRGKRFTPEEDEIVKQAVLDYVTAKGLGEEGLKMILNCKSHPGMKKCWQEIGVCIPYRPHTAVYSRAHILFERGENRTWTPEDIELLKEYQKKHGNDWKKLADELGRHRFHVKDTWRRIKLESLKAGKWSQEEYQNLHDLVNLDLQMKISAEESRKSKHGMLRDNIPWTAISEKLSTRNDATCCMKWYRQLTSSLVAEKKWSDADDYRMIGALYEIDAACADDVDWDTILEHRPGDICLKRWNQMVKHIGDYGSKSFGEQVDILAKRYCPDLAETRETWDNKPLDP